MEIFRYRVVYPGGTFVRISPSVDAEKTGEVLEYGTIFEASKSLFLDGTNYAKLSDGSGWVFHSMGEVEILELIDVVRSTDCRKLNEPAMNTATKRLGNKSQQTFWRELRNKILRCESFNLYCAIIEKPLEELYSLPSSSGLKGFGNAQSGLMSSQDQKSRLYIRRINSIARHCVDDCSDLSELDAHLWTFVHLSNRQEQVLKFTDKASNEIFEILSSSQQSKVLRCLLEATSHCKMAISDLSGSSGVRSDDIKNFLQRFIIIKVNKRKSWDPIEESLESAPATSSKIKSDSGETTGDDYTIWDRVTRTPTTLPSPEYPCSAPHEAASDSWLVQGLALNLQSWSLVSIFCGSSTAAANHAMSNNISNKDNGLKNQELAVFNSGGSRESHLNNMNNMDMWSRVKSQVHKISSDPDLQFASII